MRTEINKELIFDHFARKTSPIQRKEIEKWLTAREHEELYYHWLEEWESTHLQYVAETEEAAGRFVDFLRTHQLPIEAAGDESLAGETGNPGGRPLRKHYRVTVSAASVVLIALLSAWLFRDRVLFETYRTAYGEVATYQLSDGSTVKLNTNSVLRVPRWGFGKASRDVYLEGDASFTVTHTPDNKRFVVKTPRELEVVVLGTEFTMYAREQFSRVILKSGKVQLLYKEDRQSREITMKPGDLVTFSKNNRLELKTTQQAQVYSEWEQRRFVFEETSLEEVVYLLQENYGLTFEIRGEELGRRMLMGSFRAENVDELLQSISELLDIRVDRQGNHVLLSDSDKM